MPLTTAQIDSLIASSQTALHRAYCPYSNFRVGAALLCAGDDGNQQDIIYTGCNVENVTPIGICAEQTAFVKAISDGRRRFRAIAISASSTSLSIDLQQGPCPPCGTCRQFMVEFCSLTDFLVIMATSDGDYVMETLEQLLPRSFGPQNLSKE